MSARSRANATAKVVGELAVSALTLYGVSVGMFGVPTPPRPWSFVLLAVLTALSVPWFVLEVRERWSARRLAGGKN